MPDVSNDLGSRPFEDFQSHGRTTPPSMGGAPPVDAPDIQRRPWPRFDPQVEAVLRRLQGSEPHAKVLRGTGVVPAGGVPLIIPLDTCPDGEIWHLRRLMIGPADYLVTPYATVTQAFAFARGGPQGVFAAGASGGGGVTADTVFSLTAAFPAQGFWSMFEAVVQPGETVYAAVIGHSVAGASVTVGASVQATAIDVQLRWSQG